MGEKAEGVRRVVQVVGQAEGMKERACVRSAGREAGKRVRGTIALRNQVEGRVRPSEWLPKGRVRAPRVLGDGLPDEQLLAGPRASDLDVGHKRVDERGVGVAAQDVDVTSSAESWAERPAESSGGSRRAIAWASTEWFTSRSVG